MIRNNGNHVIKPGRNIMAAEDPKDKWKKWGKEKEDNPMKEKSKIIFIAIALILVGCIYFILRSL